MIKIFLQEFSKLSLEIDKQLWNTKNIEKYKKPSDELFELPSVKQCYGFAPQNALKYFGK